MELEESRYREKGPIKDAVGAYFSKIRNHRLLTAAEEVELAGRIAQGDLDARNELVTCNLRLVIKVAKKYMRGGTPIEDLIAEGNIGLMKAAEKFDASNGCRFSTYATYWIEQAIDRSVMNKAYIVRLPIHVVTEVRAMLKVRRELEKNGAVSLEEISEATKIPVKRLKKYERMDLRAYSLDFNAGSDDDDSTLHELIEDPKPRPHEIVEKEQTENVVWGWLERLDEKERIVIVKRFGLDGDDTKTLEELGVELGLTRERIRQIELKGMKKLKGISRGQKFFLKGDPMGRYGRQKVDLTDKKCEDCGKSAMEVPIFNIKFNRCNACATTHRRKLIRDTARAEHLGGAVPTSAASGLHPTVGKPVKFYPATVRGDEPVKILEKGEPVITRKEAGLIAKPEGLMEDSGIPPKELITKSDFPMAPEIRINFCPFCGYDLRKEKAVKMTVRSLVHNGGEGKIITDDIPVREMHCADCGWTLRENK